MLGSPGQGMLRLIHLICDFIKMYNSSFRYFETIMTTFFRFRMYAVESDIALEMLAVKEGYRYEYQGDCVQPVWYKTLEKTIYNFFTAFSMKYFPLLNGTFSCGKSTALIETCRLIAQNLVTRNITSVSEPKVIEKVTFRTK